MGYSEEADAVRILPLELPLYAARPFRVAGDLLTLNIDQNDVIREALYNIRFTVSNPSVYPHDNTWSIIVKKDIDIEFSHVMTGYVEGQVSPFDLAVGVNVGGVSNGAMPSSLLQWAAMALAIAL